MEARKLRLSTLVVCRFCLVSDENLHNLYDYDKANTQIKLNLKILSCISVEIFPSDHMPQFICNRCIHFMETYFAYKQICRQADESIMRYLEKGTTLKPIPWPPGLKKIFDKKRAVKTLEDGTTVQLSYPDGFDSDEEGDHDFYNVKIGQDQAACIKIVSEDKKKKSRQPAASKTSSPKAEFNKGKFDCKTCNKRFIRASHYMRHMKVKHPNSEEPADSFSCDQCGDVFSTQDELIYHSAIHATQNLTCPLCLEKFENVEAVTAHIKSHVNGVEFMCDLCELVFLSKNKLDAHLTNTHKDELSGVQDMEQESNSMEMDAEEEEEDDSLQVKQFGNEMLVEIKKPCNFMLSPCEELDATTTNSEESEQEAVLIEAPPERDIAVITKIPAQAPPKSNTISTLATVTQLQPAQIIKNEVKIGQTNASILKRAEEIKRKAIPKPAEPAPEKKPTPAVAKPENNNGSSNDKSLRLLEKELQELKRTNTKSEDKALVKPLDSLRNRRSQILTSTPKTRATEERKAPPSKAPMPLKKKLSIESSKDKTKENKEPKDIKPVINEKEKDSKEVKDTKEAKETKDVEKEKETPKAVKNVANSAEKVEKEENIRRSSRPSKIKDYAKLIRDKPQARTDVDSDEDDDDEEYKEDKSPEPKKRRSSQKVTPKPVAAQTPATRKRGRPRKDELPAKMKKDNPEDEKSGSEEEKEIDSKSSSRKPSPDKETPKENTIKDKIIGNKDANSTPETVKSPAIEEKPTGVLVSPTGQTLKQVPIRALPPGVKPLPLPMTPRPVGSSDVCEMQIGKKMVKVQKIVMTKAEVEAMAKKGLVEMKDGAMVLKQGIKLPTADPNTIKSTLVGDVVHRESMKKLPIKCEPDT